MSDLDFAAVERVLRQLALQAGAAIMEVYNRPEIEVAHKADASPVTEADQAADRLIFAGLQAAFADIPVVTEEQADSHSISATRFFIVDPLDGTKEFIQRRGEFTVNIALVEDGNPLRGIVYAPAQARMFYTRADGTATEEIGPFSDAGPQMRAGPCRCAPLVRGPWSLWPRNPTAMPRQRRIFSATRCQNRVPPDPR
jgi:3'(2'), 5'-bisphosphate nucleotidase